MLGWFRGRRRAPAGPAAGAAADPRAAAAAQLAPEQCLQELVVVAHRMQGAAVALVQLARAGVDQSADRLALERERLQVEQGLLRVARAQLRLAREARAQAQAMQRASDQMRDGALGTVGTLLEQLVRASEPRTSADAAAIPERATPPAAAPPPVRRGLIVSG